MVSTRQMSTSGSGTDSESSARLSVVTRATVHQPGGGNSGSTSPTTSGLIGTSVSATLSSSPSSSSLSVTNSPSTTMSTPTVVTRHSQITQALKSSGAATSGGANCGNGNGGGGGGGGTGTVATISNNNVNMENDINAITVFPIQSPSKLEDLPQEILDKIFGYVGYKKVSQCRMVSRKMNEVCKAILNSTFTKLINKTYTRFHAIKGNMPRRESARRSHPLACECDIIETCHMRLSLLQMTFGKHIERGHCCFFPGAILDEVNAIFNYISITPRLQRPYKVTDELFDLSTMAMEYFRDHIESSLPGIAYFNKDFYKLPTTTKRPSMSISSSEFSDNSSNSPPQNHMVLRKGIRKIKQGMKMYNNQLSVLRTEMRTCKRKSVEQGKQIAEQQKLIAEQQKQTLEYANRLDENDKKYEEMSRKFSTLLQELNKCKTELQFWRSKSPAIPVCLSCHQKVAPVLPPEDMQALLNQGVNPDDIIVRLNDDTDVESDISMLSDNQITLDDDNTINQQSFVYPDQVTTAKLLAANVAVKNLKRKYIHQSTTTTTTTTNNDTEANDCDQSEGLNSTTITINNTSIGNVQDAVNNAANSDTAASTSKAAAVMLQQQRQQGLLNGSNSLGYSTKLFYGNQQQQQQNQQNQQHQHVSASSTQQQQQRGGVIVSPVSKTAEKTTVASITPVIAMAGNNSSSIGLALADNNVANVNGANAATATHNDGGCGGNASNVGASGDNNDEVLQETKKARRVQKATRCVNSNGKRSK